MKILLLGSGGREHAFAWKLSQSSVVSKLWISPGNAGTADCGENIVLNIMDFPSVYGFCVTNQVDYVIPASEDPLVAGVADYFDEQNQIFGNKIRVAGPSKKAAMLEGSKEYSKDFMVRNGIPTARALSVNVDNISEGLSFLKSLVPPYVLKADGLAAGKGVIITEDLGHAQNSLSEMILGKQFGAASETVLIEEYLHGIEISVFAVSDGESWKLLGSAKDYKRIGEGDTGLNTGGMGAISPVPFADDQFMESVISRVINPTFNGLKNEGLPYRGFLFFGLMNCNGNPFVIEYNVRMGDPETEAIFPRMKTDMGELIRAISEGGLGTIAFEMDERTAATIFIVSGGYPENYNKGKFIELGETEENCIVFHAGTTRNNGQLMTSGGRVIAVTGLGNDMRAALDVAAIGVSSIKFENMYYRRDIGKDLLGYLSKS